jgi:hypothetical protein
MEEQAALHLQTEDLTTIAQTTAIAITAIEDLIIIAEIPQQIGLTHLATTVAHQEPMLLAIVDHQEATPLAIVVAVLDHTAAVAAVAE